MLKSWTIPKDPPIEVGVKRLAIAVEDHPIGYISFQGVIPEGQYGAGVVEIWDEGDYVLMKRDFKRMEFELRGKKLKGRYALIRMKNDKWLFFKLG